ncbi:hypothetical protein KA082_02400, partial [Candidatus Woesebacteria bacterium]|nr:hypothetical protein [Candidatus Woesebacteria bacterium]
MRIIVRILLFFLLSTVLFSKAVQYSFASEQSPHFTLIINQVRGSECCDKGDLSWFTTQQKNLKNNTLVGNFAIRYDVLFLDKYITAIKNDSRNDYGALLEITPQLAADAGVTYKSEVAHWYEAQNVFLIGYSPAERKKLLDTYMQKYTAVLGKPPLFSSAWMIDPWSLAYLRSQYAITAHQMTREQFGTDSYTLYGGPVHYPYYPSKNWAMIPDETTSTTMPLILRQTISDPVLIYGDTTSSYTSQPNDYFLRKDTSTYFKHLFYQAHAQPNPYTFALVGLENSMEESAQIEYESQLAEIKKWQEQDSANTVVTVRQFQQWFNTQKHSLSVYKGSTQKDSTEQAWWITTQRYRARIRLSNNELAITDLRLYDPRFTDPYSETTAQSLGWWIVPFVLDGSRYLEDSTGKTYIKNDMLKNRPATIPEPIRIVLGTTKNPPTETSENGRFTLQLNAQNQITFYPENIELNSAQPLTPTGKLPAPIAGLEWRSDTTAPAWGFTHSGNILQPFVSNPDLAKARETYRQLLFP